ncbi:MAG: hypothetical protein EP343_25120 [Deltaproteobacteria bacterium]|nr:MAG: hypothetical protein EP343_25120 [Deltaproteobacteria bacterium]
MRSHGLHLCQGCGQFTRTRSQECSFCGEQVTVAHRSLSTKAKIGVVVAVSMLSLTPMVHCGAGAYGGPPACTATSGCPANEVCDTTTGECKPNNTNPGAESTNAETITSDGGVTE